MAKEETPEQMAKTTFVITMVGTVVFCGIVIGFILV